MRFLKLSLDLRLKFAFLLTPGCQIHTAVVICCGSYLSCLSGAVNRSVPTHLLSDLVSRLVFTVTGSRAYNFIVVMVRIILLPAFGALIASVSGRLEFLNPAPFGKRGDFSNSETYTQGSTVNVAWTGSEPGKGASLVLWQLDEEGDWFGDMEYLTRKKTICITMGSP